MSAQPGSHVLRRVRVRVRGTVQGVGFRPHVYRLAGAHHLAGYVLNDSHGVLLEVEGSYAAVAGFLDRLAAGAPPLAVVESIGAEELPPTGEGGFAIRDSPPAQEIDAPVAADSATCEDCLRELADPADRRHRYPFINCTNCGPRFTIVRGIPYDRPLTTMAGFTMCEECRAEYEDPGDRRFHAQPNACPRCGPSTVLLGADGTAASPAGARDAIHGAAAALASGMIVAVKGIGGYHLACRADDERATARLRARKHREDKPFALMAATAACARELVSLGDCELEMIRSRRRPIVLAARLERAGVAESVAPRSRELGVMLPYSPLHHLLLADLAAECGAGALVMTSGNVSDEPIAYRDEDALERLGAIADLMLVHDRPIQTRTDDSVTRALTVPGGQRPLMLRRSRGHVPESIALPDGAERPILACGAELKSTFCLAKGRRAWVSHHIGDLRNYETWRSFTEGVAQFEGLLDVTPQVIAHDLHPDYMSSRYALERAGAELVGVQHHHAHMAACLAEHGESARAVGAIFDGTGYGPDGTVWGGEILVGDLDGFRRVGSLFTVRMPGGASAIREPWRMACAWLQAAMEPGSGAPQIPGPLRGVVEERAWSQVAGLARTGVSSPLTSSIGRLFDAVAAICGLAPRVTYEGQAAIELEAACDPGEHGRYPIGVREGPELIIDARPTILAAAQDVRRGASPGVVASRFHGAVADATIRASTVVAGACGTDIIVLSGGVFQNRRLLEASIAGLTGAGLRVLVPERLPIGDGGISFGQAAIAARRISKAPGRGGA